MPDDLGGSERAELERLRLRTLRSELKEELRAELKEDVRAEMKSEVAELAAQIERLTQTIEDARSGPDDDDDQPPAGRDAPAGDDDEDDPDGPDGRSPDGPSGRASAEAAVPAEPQGDEAPHRRHPLFRKVGK